MKKEKILVVPIETEIKKYIKNGVFEFKINDLNVILNNGVYGERRIMENNFNFKQIIGYVAFISKKKVLIYQRSKKSGESRTFGNYSLGVGGHIDLESINSKSNLDILLDGTIREVKEELDLDISKQDLDIKYYINDESNDIGKLHFGIGFVINKENISLNKGEVDILENRKFMNRNEVKKIYPKLEEWSKLFYNKIIKDLID